MTTAARAAGLPPRTLYAWRQDDVGFRQAWDAARLAGDDAVAARLEAEADRRATRGTREPVFASGKLVGHRRKYSDALLMFRLRALRPQRYTSNARNGEDALQVELRDFDAEEGQDGS